MRHLPTVARILLGLIFFVFGLNFFFHFIPNPPPPPAADAFARALFATGYLFPLLKTFEVLSGLALLAGRFVPLALTLLAPIIVNILFFHAFLLPAGLALPAVVVVLELYLAWSYRDAFRPLLNPRAQPVRSPAS
jgi:putative oxidoreductase